MTKEEAKLINDKARLDREFIERLDAMKKANPPDDDNYFKHDTYENQQEIDAENRKKYRAENKHTCYQCDCNPCMCGKRDYD